MRNLFLEFINKILKIKFPGRYVLSQIAAKILKPRNGYVHGHIGSYLITLKISDLIQQQIYFGIYEDKETLFFKKLLGPGDIFFDIGANVGYYSFLASQFVGNTGMVYAFEPISSNVTSFEENIHANAIANIIINPVAVGSENGSIILYTENEELGNSGWASRIRSIRRTKEVLVEVISLDEYIQKENISHVHLVKMDIEGSELDALKGGQLLFSKEDAPDIICEVNPFLLGLINLNSTALTRYLKNYGYHIYEIGSNSILDPDVAFTDLKNLYCTKKFTQAQSLINK